MTLDQFKAQYEEAMRNQGVTVTWAEDGGAPYSQDVGGYRNPDNWVATLSRDGVSTTSLVTLGRMASSGNDVQTVVNYDVQFGLRRAGQLGSPQGSVPSSFFEPIDDDTRRFYEVYPHLRPGYKPPTSTPGPATTMATPNTVQPTQSPADPANGTLVAPPSSNGTSAARLTFWQWNYYYEQQTGRSGAAPEDVPGVSSGNQMMTGAEWAAAMTAYFGSPVSAPPLNGSGGAVGGTQTTPNIPVGGSTSPTGGATNTPATLPVGGTATTGAPNSQAGALQSFWAWNAIKEQATGIVGDDPANYGIEGSAQMTLAAWQAMTAGYYATRTGGAGGAGGVKKDDNTLLLIGGALAAFMLLRKAG